MREWYSKPQGSGTCRVETTQLVSALELGAHHLDSPETMARSITTVASLSLVLITCAPPRNIVSGVASGPVREAVIAVERQAWEAFKNKDGAFYRRTLTADASYVSSGGVNTREEIAGIAERLSCKVDGYVLRNEQVHSMSANVALLTLRATSDLTCGTRSIHSDAWVSTVFVRDGGEWKISFHQETDIPPRG